MYRKIGGHSYPVGLFRTDRRDHYAAVSRHHSGYRGCPSHPACAVLARKCARLRSIFRSCCSNCAKRSRKFKRQETGGVERFAFRLFAWIATHPKIYLLLASLGSLFFPLVPNIGPLKKWASQRTLPEPAKQSFHQCWAGSQGFAMTAREQSSGTSGELWGGPRASLRFEAAPLVTRPPHCESLYRTAISMQISSARNWKTWAENFFGFAIRWQLSRRSWICWPKRAPLRRIAVSAQVRN